MSPTSENLYFSPLTSVIANYLNNLDRKVPTVVTVRSEGPAAELYPDSLGEYRLLPDLTHNDLPVFQHLARDDRYIISVGKLVQK